MMGELSPDEIDELLRSETLGRIGCIADGWPYVVPVAYVYDGESVYVHSAEGLKLRAMRDNPQVCFEVERVRSTTHWRTVIAKGHFEPLWRDTGDRTMNLLGAKFSSAPPGACSPPPEEHGGRIPLTERPVVYRIRLVEKTGRFEKH